jgi:hypothetical protein
LDLEQHIDCLIIFDHFEDEDIPIKDTREIEFFSEKPKVEKKVPEKKVPEKKKMDMFDDMMGGDDSDEMDLMDFDMPPKKKEVKTERVSELDFNFEQAPEKRVEPYRTKVEATVNNECQNILNKLQKFCSKQRQSLLMHISLICLAYKMCKFYIVKDILSKDDLLKVLKKQIQNL